MLKNRLRQTGSNSTLSSSQGVFDSQIRTSNQTTIQTNFSGLTDVPPFHGNTNYPKRTAGRVSCVILIVCAIIFYVYFFNISSSNLLTLMKPLIGIQRQVSAASIRRNIPQIHLNDMSPNSFNQTLPTSNRSIPLKSIFGRVLKDITNIPQSGVFGTETIPLSSSQSTRFAPLSQTPYVPSTSMGYCKGNLKDSHINI